MKIDQIMTPSPATCAPTDNLGQVVEHMWDADCGIVPVVDDGGHLLGVITGYGELLRENLGPHHPGANRVEQILGAAARAAGIPVIVMSYGYTPVAASELHA